MKLKLLTLVLLCVCTTVSSQTEKFTSQQESEPIINEQLLKYANVLVANSDDPTIKLANEEAKMEAINSTYNALLDNSISADQRSDLYIYIINRTVKNDWIPELKALVLYAIQSNSTDKEGKPLYMMNSKKLMSEGVLEFYKMIPALDPARGNDNLSEAQQLQLINEKIDELKASDASINKYLAAFK